jgi:CheY-like chemotaxis protein
VQERAEAHCGGQKLNTHELRSPGLSPKLPAKILLVDDSEGIRLLISEILSEAGYEVTAVSNGDAALLAVRRQAPEVVITDLHMPGRPVSEVIRVLREDHPEVRIVILSGLMDDLMSKAIMASGVDAAIDKGMAPEILVDTIKRLLISA